MSIFNHFPILKEELSVEYYHGIPGEYFCYCLKCKSSFLGDKRDFVCPKCKKIDVAAVYRDDEGYAFFDKNDDLIKEWPQDWPDIIDDKFLRDRNIKIL